MLIVFILQPTHSFLNNFLRIDSSPDFSSLLLINLNKSLSIFLPFN